MARGQTYLGKYAGYCMAAAKGAMGLRNLVKGVQQDGVQKRTVAHQQALTERFIDANGRAPDSSENANIGTAAASLARGRDVSKITAALGLGGGPAGGGGTA